MSSLLPITRPSSLRTICISCRRSFHSTSSRLQEQSSPSSQSQSQSRSQSQSQTQAQAQAQAQTEAKPASRPARAETDVTGLLSNFQRRSQSFSANSTARLANADADRSSKQRLTDTSGSDALYEHIGRLHSSNRPGRGISISPASRGGNNFLADTARDLRRSSARRGVQTHEDTWTQAELRKRIGRPWMVGDVYAPADLGPREQRKWLARQTGQSAVGDVFEMIGKSPLAFYRNFTVLSEFMTETGRIKPASLTGLKRKNQRKMAKTIRRAVGLSIIPSMHKHPMILGKAAGVPGY